MKRFFSHLKHIWKLLLLLFLFFIAFSYAMFQGGFVSWFLFYSFIPFALYGLALSFYRITKFKVKREITKQEYHAGEKLQVKIIVKRSLLFPLFYIVIEDLLSEELAFLSNSKAFIFPFFRKELTFEYEINELPRGEYIFNEIEIKVGDPLGLIEKTAVIPTEEERIIVYPSYEEFIFRTNENHYDQGMAASKERVQRDTSMAVGIREYQPGDRFSWINWKATAKRNDMMTKEFEQRKSHDVYIVMDCVRDEHFEAIVSFAASLIRAILRTGAQLGFLSSTRENRVAFPVRSGEVHQQQLFYHLAKVKCDSTLSLDKVLEKEGFFLVENGSFILITSQLTKNLINKASFYSSRKGNVTIYVLKDKKEKTSETELALKGEAVARGVYIVFVHDGDFSAAFSEVKRS